MTDTQQDRLRQEAERLAKCLTAPDFHMRKNYFQEACDIVFTCLKQERERALEDAQRVCTRDTDILAIRALKEAP